MKTKKFWFKFTVIFLSVIFGIISVLAGLAYYFENNIADFVLKRAYTYLDTKATHQKINFSLLRNFPKGTLTFYDVQIQEKTDSVPPENLFQAQYLHFGFDFWDLIRGNFRITKITAQNGEINLKIFQNQTNNFSVFKPDTTSKPIDFALHLDQIQLQNITIKYWDEINAQHYIVDARKVNAKGNFSAQKYDLELSGDFFLKLLNINKKNYLTNKSVQLDILIDIDRLEKQYRFDEARLRLEDLNFKFNGIVAQSGAAISYSLKIAGDQLHLKQLLNTVPDILTQPVKQYKPSGNIDFTASVEGLIQKKHQLGIQLNATLKNGKMEVPNTGHTMDSIRFELLYQKPLQKNNSPEELTLKNFSARLKEGFFNADLTVRNLKKPEISLTLKADLDLQILHSFINLGMIELLKGRFDTDFKLKLKADSPNISLQDLKKAQMSGVLNLQNISGILTYRNLKLEQLNAKLRYVENQAVIDHFEVKTPQSDLALSGTIHNLLPFIWLPQQPIIIKAYARSKNLDLNEILQSETVAGESELKPEFNPLYELDLNFEANHIQWGKYTADDAHAKLTLKNGILNLQHFKMNTFDGIISGNAEANFRHQKERVLMTGYVKTENTDIQKLFWACDNFGQNEMTDRNLKGHLDAEIWFSSIWDAHFNCDWSQLKSQIHFTIKEGGLLNFKPLENLSKFIRLEELQNIQFKTLTNEIAIMNETITMPTMKIENNACNLIFSGNQTFAGALDYQLEIKLQDALTAKFRKRQTISDAVKEDAPSRVTIFVNIGGTLSNPKFSWNLKWLKNSNNESVLKERNAELKEAFKDIRTQIRDEGKVNASTEAHREVIFDDDDLKPASTTPQDKPKPLPPPKARDNEVIFEDD